MMKMKNKIYVGFVLLFTFACGAGLSGLARVNLEVLGKNESTEIGNALNEGMITYTKAKIVLSEIEFEQASQCEDDDGSDIDETEIDYEGPYIINLLAKNDQSSLGEVQLNAGRYCKLKIKLDKLEDDDLPSGIGANDEMVDLSVLIEGENDEGINFIIKLEEDQEYELESVSGEGFLLNPDVSNTLFLVFDLGRLFFGIEFDDLEMNGNTVLIDENNNEGAYENIVENLKNFSSLSSDSDDDSELDEDDDEIAD
jgi:hypothetical protein